MTEVNSDDATRLLDELQAQYVVEDVPLDKIDPASLKRQVRGVEVRIETRDQYAQAMRLGDQFPKIIVRRTARGLYYVVDGIHRVLAAKQVDRPTIEACVIDWSTEQSRVISFTANRRHGDRTTHEEAVHHAIELIRNQGYAINQASALLRVASSTVRSEMDRQNAKLRAIQLGVPGFDRLAPTSQLHLSRIKQDQPFVAAANLAVSRKLPLKAVEELSTRVRVTRSETAALAAVQEFANQPIPVQSNKSREMGSIQRLRTAIGTIDGVNENSLRSELAGQSQDELKELATKFRRTATRLSLFADVAS